MSSKHEGHVFDLVETSRWDAYDWGVATKAKDIGNLD